MRHPDIDPSLVRAWQVAHSIARGAPAPVPDLGGYRVDTASEKEVKRWTFPRLTDGVGTIGRAINAPRHYIKVCAPNQALRRALPSRWEIQPAGFLMTTSMGGGDSLALPKGYELQLHRTGSVSRASVIAPDGGLAASGYAAESAEAFVYDRIETGQEHRRKGLGVAVMTALGTTRTSIARRQLLVATEDGRKLYERLGWIVLAPLATAVIPER